MMHAPLRIGVWNSKPWEGGCRVKPWEYEVSAAIPCLGTPETLPVIIDLLRLQTVPPFIMLIDTGSLDEELRHVISLRAEDVEVHCLRLNGVRHPSDFPAIAMDLAFSLCRSPYLLCTHADVFLRSRTVIEELVGLLKDGHPVVGYELTPRSHPDWKGMVSHTCTLLDMKVMDSINAGWSQRRLCHQRGIVDYSPDPLRPNWPDTELLLNYQLRDAGIVPYLVGSEQNYERFIDDRIDHCRTYTASKLYSRHQHFAKAHTWVLDAVKQAKLRVVSWRQECRKSIADPGDGHAGS